jgi:hypothetical protein
VSLPQVIAFSREKAGVGGKKSKEDVERDFAGAYKVVFGDVTVRACWRYGLPQAH